MRPRGVIGGLFSAVLLSLVVSIHGLQCTSYIYCQGPLLDKIQRAQLFNDSKTFVDMPTKVPPAAVLAAFNNLSANASVDDLLNFTSTYFYPSGYEVRSVIPYDWSPTPSFLSNIADPNLRAWAAVVHSKWRNLVRVFAQDQTCGLDCYSSIPVPYPFVIAGGRFLEYYYWDSLWIVEGLLVSGMLNTTRGVLLNFMHLIDTYGFIPNGGRIYYLDRSQPPVTTQMVRKYYEATNVCTADVYPRVENPLGELALPRLDQEYQFWMQNRTVPLTDSKGNSYVLNNYNVTNLLPRPESYLNDLNTASVLPTSARPALWGQIATGAETGWDFSSRWFADGMNLTTIQAKDIIPVDLNSILYANEMSLAGWHAALGNDTMAKYYQQQAAQRRQAITAILWNEEENMWTDYNHVTNVQSSAFYPSNFYPIWANASVLTGARLASIFIKQAKFFSYPAGVPTSGVNTTQQWDFPNAWAPLQFFLIESLLSVPAMESLGQSLIQKWIITNYCAWNNTGGNVSGLMFEKYDATQVGMPGQGGEYVVQDGFGWTNGVVLRYLNKFGSTLKLPPGACPPTAFHTYYNCPHGEPVVVEGTPRALHCPPSHPH